MRILLVTQIVPYPPDAGPKVKTYNVIKYLGQRHDVTLASFVRSQEERASADALNEHCSSIHTVPIRRSPRRDARHLVASMVSEIPFLVARDNVPAMHRVVQDLLRREHFDVIHADQLTMAQYAMPATGQLTVLDEHNAVWTIVRRMCKDTPLGPKRLLMEIEWRKLLRYEGEMCRRFDHTLTVIDEDRQALLKAAGRPCNISVIPIGVDTVEITPIRRLPKADEIISIATMFYPPNIDGVTWFTKEVFPLVRASRPETRLLIVGARPPRQIERLMSADPNVVVTGYIEDVTPLIARSGVLIVPLRAGSGMRVKILEAFARGIPVVSTTLGCEGIQAEHERHLLLADTPDAFAMAILWILKDRAAADAMAMRARRLVEERYDWRVVCRALDLVHAGLQTPAKPST